MIDARIPGADSAVVAEVSGKIQDTRYEKSPEIPQDDDPVSWKCSSLAKKLKHKTYEVTMHCPCMAEEHNYRPSCESITSWQEPIQEFA